MTLQRYSVEFYSDISKKGAPAAKRGRGKKTARKNKDKKGTKAIG